MLYNVEFYTFENELWYRDANGNARKFTEKSDDITAEMIQVIEEFYPEAYAALEKEYAKCKNNIRYFRYRIVLRFCRCNFGKIDNIKDIDNQSILHFEHVTCPLRGECQLEGIVCHPEFNHRISPAEMRVLKLWYNGLSKKQIAEELYLSYHTVCNHIHNAFMRLNLHNKAEFIKYAETNNLFK